MHLYVFHMKRQNIHMKNHDINTSASSRNLTERMKVQQVQHKNNLQNTDWI